MSKGFKEGRKMSKKEMKQFIEKDSLLHIDSIEVYNTPKLLLVWEDGEEEIVNGKFFKGRYFF